MMTKTPHSPNLFLATTAAATLILLSGASLSAQNAHANNTPASPVQNQQVASNAPKASGTQQEPNRAQAYYHSALAATYEDDAISEGRSEDVTQAIEQYKLALDADPGSAELMNALADLYFRTPGHEHDAEVTARTLLKSWPDNVDAHKLGEGDVPEADWGEAAAEGTMHSANHSRRGVKTEAERGQGARTRRRTKDSSSRRSERPSSLRTKR